MRKSYPYTDPNAEKDVEKLCAHVETLTQQVAELKEELAGHPVLKTEWQQLNEALAAERQMRSEVASRAECAERENARLTAERDEAEARAVDAIFRMKQAEQQRDAAHAALKQIVDESDSACGCDHTDENCCVLQGGGCAFCTAAVALDAALAASAPQKEEPQCRMGIYCREHNFIHGAEAEELRERIEAMLQAADEDDDSREFRSSLWQLLDNVDARDSVTVPAPAQETER
jgi:chromosome segregation ATPase